MPRLLLVLLLLLRTSSAATTTAVLSWCDFDCYCHCERHALLQVKRPMPRGRTHHRACEYGGCGLRHSPEPLSRVQDGTGMQLGEGEFAHGLEVRQRKQRPIPSALDQALPASQQHCKHLPAHNPLKSCAIQSHVASQYRVL